MTGVSKVRAELLRFIDGAISFFPAKGVVVTFEGQGLSDPLISNLYNVDTVTRIGIGLYRVKVLQTTFWGQNIFERATPKLESIIPSNPDSDLHDLEFLDAGAGDDEFDIQVKEVVQGAGNQLDVNPYDIEAGDFVFVGLDINIGRNDDLPPAGA